MWEDRYKTPDYLFGRAPTKALPRLVTHLPAGARVLSLAEGEGRNAVWMATQGFDVTGVEYAPSALAKAQALADHHKVTPRFVQADLFDWDWPEPEYDAVLGLFIQFVGPEGRRQIHRNVARALRPGGVVILHGYRPEQLAYGTGGPPFAENLYLAEDLQADFPGWEVLALDSYDTELAEGPAHVGMSALLDFVARKPI